MSHRGTKAKGDTARRRQLRNEGYADGFAGRPAKYVDAGYQASWRRGREARADLNDGGDKSG